MNYLVVVETYHNNLNITPISSSLHQLSQLPLLLHPSARSLLDIYLHKIIVTMKLYQLLQLSLLILVTLTSALKLTDIQGITQFPSDCTAAYSVDITDCTDKEITLTGKIQRDRSGICSIQCIRALAAVMNNINFSCGNIEGRPGSLIAIFFANQGVSYLCPNSIEGVEPSPTSTGGNAAASTTTSTGDAAQSSEPPSVNDGESTATESSTTVAPSSATPQASSTKAFVTTTAVNNGVAEVITSETQRAASENADAFGGGGSPFEVSGNTAGAIAVPALLFSIPLLSALWVLMGT